MKSVVYNLFFTKKWEKTNKEFLELAQLNTMC